jgi:SAM-dependent methyltransferase
MTPKTMMCSKEIPNILPIYLRCLRVSIALSLLGLPGQAKVTADEIKPSGLNTYQQVTGDGAEEDRRRWDSIFNRGTYVYGKQPAPFVRESIDKLPLGRALDIAMGEGRNAVYLAKKGFLVDAVDISDVGIRKAKRLARENHVVLTTINADLNTYQIRPDFYEVIINIDFLLRPLVAQIKRGLKRGGVVVFQNHTEDQLKNPGGAQIPKDYLLKKGELKELFKDFEIISYQETNDGKDANASLIARKP